MTPISAVLLWQGLLFGSVLLVPFVHRALCRVDF